MTVDRLDLPFNTSNGGEAVAALKEFLHGFVLPIENELLCSGVWELIRNVNEWSHSTGCLSAYVESDHVVIAVEDSGVGIYHNLNSEFGARSPAEAVEMALQVGTTSSGDMFRGRGLPFCLGLTEQGGSMLVETVGASASGWSGETKGVTSSRGQDRGTLVTLRFPLVSI